MNNVRKSEILEFRLEICESKNEMNLYLIIWKKEIEKREMFLLFLDWRG